MSISLVSLVNLHIFTPGRRVSALRRILDMARAEGLSDLVTPVEQALAHEHETAALEDAWGATQADALPIALDPQLERDIILIDRFLRHHATRDGEVGQYACELGVTLFPQGVSSHIRLPLVEQLAASEEVLRILEEPERAAWVDRLGLRALVAELCALNNGFAAAMRRYDAMGGATYEEVRAARERGQELFLAVVVRILGKCVSGADARIMARLLRPIQDQNEAIRLCRQQRRRLVDIDPDTGDCIETIVGEDQPPLPPDDLASIPDEVLDFDGIPIASPEAN